MSKSDKDSRTDAEVKETANATKRQEVIQGGGGKDGKEVSGQAMNATPSSKPSKSKPSNEQLVKENKESGSQRPEELMDTDVENEFKENGGKFRKQTDKARL